MIGRENQNTLKNVVVLGKKSLYHLHSIGNIRLGKVLGTFLPKGRYSGHSIPTDMVNTPCSGRHGRGGILRVYFSRGG